TIDLDQLLATPGPKRAKWLEDHAGQKLTGQALTSLKSAESLEDLLAALDKKIQKKVTPRIVPSGAMVLQPSDERRRSGSHYTPRSLTAPIVRTTLAPILKQLVEGPGAGGQGSGDEPEKKKRKAETPHEQRLREAAEAARQV